MSDDDPIAVAATRAEDICAAHPAAELSYPFGPESAVYKVVGKVFGMVSIGRPYPRVSLKIDPEDARALVEEFDEIEPGYHLNKKHWISVALPWAAVPMEELVQESYDLVVAKLPRASRPKP